MAETLYTLHINIEKIEIKQVITDEWKFFNIVNSSDFFMLEFEELKSCISPVEISNVGKGL